MQHDPKRRPLLAPPRLCGCFLSAAPPLHQGFHRLAATLLILDEGSVAKGRSPDSGAQTSVLSLSNAGDGCTDIAELLMHATARFIQAEEEILGKLLPEEKTK